MRPIYWASFFGRGPLWAVRIEPSNCLERSIEAAEFVDRCPRQAKVVEVLPLRTAILRHTDQFGTFLDWIPMWIVDTEGKEKLVMRRGFKSRDLAFIRGYLRIPKDDHAAKVEWSEKQHPLGDEELVQEPS